MRAGVESTHLGVVLDKTGDSKNSPISFDHNSLQRRQKDEENL